MKLHPLVPIGSLVGFAWIIALALAVSGPRPVRGATHGKLVERMCACTTMHCIDEVEREVGELPPPGRDDALEAYGQDQELKACKRTALRKAVE
jgi:hypothetical protein